MPTERIDPSAPPAPGTVHADQGVGDVHTPAPLSGVGTRTAAALPAAKRKALPKNAFALPALKKYPIHDASHARAAMGRLEQNKNHLTPTQYETAKANILKAYKRFGIKHKASPTGTRASIRTAGLSIHVHQMRDASVDVAGGELRTCAVELDVASLEAMLEEPKPVWNQLAKIGQWAGHPAGPFQIGPKEIAQIIANFRSQTNQKIPIDYEHASEQPAYEGTIPIHGAPACGWILDLEDRGADGLWGLVEWSELARRYITAKPPMYRYFSPAIRFNAKDRVTNAQVGARMTSGALTNTPFLDGMAEMAASDADTTTTTLTYAHGPDEYMPRMRIALGMDPLATARECMERVCRLEELLAKAGAPVVCDGVDLGHYLPRMRDMLGASIGCTWEQVFDTLKDLLRAAGVPDDDDEGGAISSRSMKETTMAENDLNTITMKLGAAEAKLKDAETRASAAEAKLKETEGTLVTLRATEQALRTSETALNAKVTTLEGANATLSLKLTEAETSLTSKTAELAKLKDAEEKRLAKDAEGRVDAAIATYSDRKGITAAQKPTLLTLLKADPEGFEAMFPPIPTDQQYLLRTVVPAGGGTANAAKPVDPQVPTSSESLFELSEKIRREKNCSREHAILEARRQLATHATQQNGLRS